MGWTGPSDRSTGDTITSAIWNENVGAAGNSALLKTSVNNSGALSFVDATELTIASGVITVTQNYHKVDVETGSTDDVTTITAGANIVAGHVLHLRVESAARTVVLKTGTGGSDNLDIGDSDITLDESFKTFSLVLDSDGNWRPFTFAESPTFASLSPLTTRGDLLVATTTVTGVRLPVGGANEVLTSDGTDAAWAAVASSPVVGYTATTAAVSNTTSKSPVVTIGQIGANDWDDGDILTISLAVQASNNSGSSRTVTWEVDIEGNTQTHTKVWENGATVGYLRWEISLMRAGAEIYWGFGNQQVTSSGLNWGDGSFLRIASVDFTAAIDVVVRLTFPTASASLYITPQSAQANLIKRTT